MPFTPLPDYPTPERAAEWHAMAQAWNEGLVQLTQELNAASPAESAVAVAQALANKTDPAQGAKIVGYSGRSVAERLDEMPAIADAASVQAALNKPLAHAADATYAVSTPLKIGSMSRICGPAAGIGMTGSTATIKRAFQKTGTTAVTVTNAQTGVSTSVNCIAYIDPAWINSGAAYPQKTTLERLGFRGATATPTTYGLYIEQAGGCTFRELDFTNCTHGIYAKECWLSTLERVHSFGKITWKGGTSVTLTACWTGAGPGGTSGGYDFASLIYSTMNSCASDGATNTAYRFSSCAMTLNACGCEGAGTVTPNSGTAIAFDTANRITLNDFTVVPKAGQTIALFSVGNDNRITFHGGKAAFGVTTTAPDIYVHGSNSVVVFEDFEFQNGSMDAPVVDFAANTTNSKVIVRWGDNEKVFTANSAGAEAAESFKDGGTFTPTLKFGGASTGMAASTATGQWTKLGKLIRITGRIVLTAKGTATGQATLGGWPAFLPATDAGLQLTLQTGVSGGPLIGMLDAGGTAAVLRVRGGSGDADATATNFSNVTELRFEMLIEVA